VTRRRLLLNVAVGLLACLFAAGLTRELLAAYPLPTSPAPRGARPAAVPALASPASVPAPASYGVIAAKNLFSPSRSEAAAGPVAAVGPKPLLHGVVVDGPKSRAFLEDPVVKRTFGYAVGDTIGGGRVESISADRVVIGRADGLVEVLLQDPAKPKAPTPAAPSPTAAAAPSAVTPPRAGSTPGAAEARPPSAPAPAAPPSRVLNPGSRVNER
jgi:hypothetical protein